MAGARLFRWCSRTLDWILRLDFGFLLGWFLKGVGVLSVWYLAVITWLGVASPHPDGARATLLEFVKQWRVSVPVVLASILVTFNFGDKILRLRRREDEHDERADYEEMALHELRKRLQVKKKATDWKTAWEPSLKAAQIELEAALGIRDKNLIKTNLVLVNKQNQIVVHARSRPGSPCPQTHPNDDSMPSTCAIKSNRTVVCCNVRTKRGFENKPYDCVAATPVADRTKAHGAITADSREPTTFMGKEAIIDRVLRPYCAQILLTLPENADYHPCPESFNR